MGNYPAVEALRLGSRAVPSDSAIPKGSIRQSSEASSWGMGTAEDDCTWSASMRPMDTSNRDITAGPCMLEMTLVKSLSGPQFPHLEKENLHSSINTNWDFPVVQWLRLHSPHAGDSGLIPGQGTRSHLCN